MLCRKIRSLLDHDLHSQLVHDVVAVQEEFVLELLPQAEHPYVLDLHALGSAPQLVNVDLLEFYYRYQVRCCYHAIPLYGPHLERLSQF